MDTKSGSKVDVGVVDTLTDLILPLTTEDGSSIGNGALIILLRDHVPGLSEEAYAAARDVLVEEGTLGRERARRGHISSDRVDNTMIKAIACGFRWRKLLETGVHTTVEDMAAAEKFNASDVSRVLRLTLLAPDIVEAILDGWQGPEITLAKLMKPLPVEWESSCVDSRFLYELPCSSSRIVRSAPPTLKIILKV